MDKELVFLIISWIAKLFDIDIGDNFHSISQVFTLDCFTIIDHLKIENKISLDIIERFIRHYLW